MEQKNEIEEKLKEMEASPPRYVCLSALFSVFSILNKQLVAQQLSCKQIF